MKCAFGAVDRIAGKMGQNLQIAEANSSESDLDADQMSVVLRRLMKEELGIILIPTVQQVIGPIVENLVRKVVFSTVKQDIGPIVEELIRKVVKEEIPSSLEKFLANQNHENSRYRNSTGEATSSRARSLELKFLDEVSDSVLTGKEIKGKGDTHIRVAVVDNVTGKRVDSGAEASAKVEIVLLEDNNANNFSLNDFNNNIIRESDKSKPRFSRPVYIYLQQGIGTLSNKVKLGHDLHWKKRCRCRLGARAVDGSSLKEAWTESFTVQDGRCKYNEKPHQPSLSDEVWKLENIGKYGDPCRRLHEANIFTVRDFLFLYSVDPERLKEQILGAVDKKWKVMVDHALRFRSDDKKMYSYRSSSECTNGVVFDVVGQLKGVLRSHQYVPLEDVDEAEKAEAKKLLASAFENQKDITSFEEETSTSDQLPRPSNDGNAPDDCDGISIEDIYSHDPTQPDTSSQGTSSPSKILNDFGWFDSVSCNVPEYPYGLFSEALGESSIYPCSDLRSDLEHCGITLSSNANLSETGQIESSSGEQCIVDKNRFIKVEFMTRRWLVRVREKATSLGDSQMLNWNGFT